MPPKAVARTAVKKDDNRKRMMELARQAQLMALQMQSIRNMLQEDNGDPAAAVKEAAGSPVSEPLQEAAEKTESALPEVPLSQSERQTQEKEVQQAAVEQPPAVSGQSRSHGGIPTRQGIYEMAGGAAGLKLEKIDKHKALAGALNAIDAYHAVVDESFDYGSTTYDMRHKTDEGVQRGSAAATEALRDVVQAIGVFRKKCNKRSTNMRQLLPALAVVEMQCYQTLPRLENAPGAAAAFVASGDRKVFTLADIVDAPEMIRFAGHMARTDAQASLDIAEGTDAARHALKNGGSIANYYASKDGRIALNTTTLGFPMPQPGAPGFMRNLAQIPLELDRYAETLNNMGKESPVENAQQMKYFYYPLLRLVAYVQSHPYLEQMAADTKQQDVTKTAEEREFAALLREMGGKNLLEANKLAEQHTFQTVEKAGPGAKTAGDAMSKVLLDKSNNRILRESSGKETVGQQKTSAQAYNDEALSKLDELIGGHLIARAHTTLYENDKGEKTFGSQMEFAQGTESRNLNFGVFGDDKSMMMDQSRTTVDLSQNPRLVNDMLRLQVIDVLCHSTDRHSNNYFVKLDAAPGESMITGIDNDQAFGDYETIGGFYRSQDSVMSEKRLVYSTMAMSKAFAVVTPEVAQGIASIKADEVDRVLAPYQSRTQRMFVLSRLRQLQDFVAGSSKVADLNTAEGQKLFAKMQKEQVYQTMTEALQLDGFLMNRMVGEGGSLMTNALIESFVQGAERHGISGDRSRVAQTDLAMQDIGKALYYIGHTPAELEAALKQGGKLGTGDKIDGLLRNLREGYAGAVAAAGEKS